MKSVIKETHKNIKPWYQRPSLRSPNNAFLYYEDGKVSWAPNWHWVVCRRNQQAEGSGRPWCSEWLRKTGLETGSWLATQSGVSHLGFWGLRLFIYKKGAKISPLYHRVVLGLNEVIRVTHLTQCLAHRECSITEG